MSNVFSPFSHSSFAAHPPLMPEPTTIASYCRSSTESELKFEGEFRDNADPKKDDHVAETARRPHRSVEPGDDNRLRPASQRGCTTERTRRLVSRERRLRSRHPGLRRSD